jgi:hypothetical protein
MNVSKDSDGLMSLVSGSGHHLVLLIPMTWLIWALGCSGASNSEIKSDAAVAGTGGSGAGAAVGSGGTTPGTGGAGGVTGVGTGGVGVVGTGGAAGGTTGTCPALTSMTLAQLTVMDASWAGSTATSAGTGKIYLWNLVKLTANGNQLSGQTQSCGTVLPAFSLTGAGQLVTGGTMVLVEVPHAVWETPTIPKFPTTGSFSGWNPGSTLTIDGTIALVGLTLTDPRAAWPASYTALSTVDADGDTKPGITAVPRNGGGYVLPPTGLGLFGSAPQADQIYLASRTMLTVAGRFDTCTAMSGTSTVPFFDSHVVGCHIRGGADCTPAQIDFVDQSRTIYQIGSATFAAKQVPDTATCAQVRAALPMM